MKQMGRIAVIAPCYNEEGVITRFLDELSPCLSSSDAQLEIVLVDDGSSDATVANALEWGKSNSTPLQVIRLSRNSGHQNAIAAGVRIAYEQGFSGAVVMDSDGEDDPSVIPAMLSFKDAEVIQITRGKRSEGLLFRLGYFFYKILFRWLTGKRIDFGNFSFISRRAMQAVASESFIHYPAFLSRLNFKKGYIKADRKTRIGGQSKMGFSGLALHGIRALAEFSEELLMAFLKLTLLFGLALLIITGVVLYKKFVSMEAIPGWTSTMLVGAFTAMLISGGFFILGVILLRLSKVQNSRIPIMNDEA